MEEDISKKVSNVFFIICCGFGLQFITIDLFYLNYILPFAGSILIYYGFRNLRYENKYSFVTYILSILNCFDIFMAVLVSVSVFNNSQLYLIICCISNIIRIIILIFFLFAMIEMYKSINCRISVVPFLGLIILTVITNMLLFISFYWNNLLISIISLIIMLLYTIFLIMLYILGSGLDKNNYVLSFVYTTKWNKLSTLAFTIFTICVVFGLSVYSNHIIVNGVEINPYPIDESRNELIQMGLPENIAVVLSDNVIDLFRGADKITTYNQYYAYTIYHNDLTAVKEYDKIKANSYRKVIANTMVFVKMSDGDGYLLNYYDWIKGNSYYKDIIAMNSLFDKMEIEVIESKLFYNKDSKNYTSDIGCSMIDLGNNESVLSNLKNDNNYLISTFNFPYDSENNRAYILIKTSLQDKLHQMPWYSFYCHQYCPFSLPYLDTKERVSNRYDTVNMNNDLFTTYYLYEY